MVLYTINDHNHDQRWDLQVRPKSEKNYQNIKFHGPRKNRQKVRFLKKKFTDLSFFCTFAGIKKQKIWARFSKIPSQNYL
jgi:hypothetical protein